MRRALRDAALVMAAYVAVVWLLLALLRGPVALIFNASGTTAELVEFFCLLSGFMWFFVGLLFVSNASFNNLGFPLLSTGFNWARATLGMVPFALLGAQLGGPKGALLGIAAGSVPFGLAAIVTAFWTIRRLERAAAEKPVGH
jgi:Na+-driven multidrug efflux pump